MKIKAIIVGDEQGARESLNNILNKYFEDEVLVLGVADGVEEATSR